MNALEAASLVMIPSGYENGTLGSLKPTDGSGDFTFSRGSDISATRVNANGYIEKGYENLLLQSNTFDTTWSVANGGGITGGQAGYDGTNDAWYLYKNTGTSSQLVRQIISSTGVQTFSFYAKAAELEWIRFLWIGGSGGRSHFHLVGNGDTGVLTNTISTSIELVGDGWYKCSTTINENISQIQIYPASGSNSVSGSTGGVYIQDAMLNQGLVAYPYLETTTAPVAGGILEDMPRLDYSSCPALLLEPSRTNLVEYSEYANAVAGSLAIITDNVTTSPEGVQNAARFLPTSAFGRWESGSFGGSITNGTTYVASMYFNTNSTLDIVTFYIGWNAAAGADRIGITFNPSTRAYISTFTAGSATLTDYDIGEADDNGWYRVSLIAPATNANANTCLVLRDLNSQANGSDFVDFYGWQTEAGSYPTSYIPTYGVSQTRLAESCVVNNATSSIGQTEGTMFLDFVYENNGGGLYGQYVANATGLTDFVAWRVLDISPNTLQVLIRYNNNYQVVGQVSSVFEFGNRYKVALKYSSGDIKVFVNNQEKFSSNATYTTPTLPLSKHTISGANSIQQDTISEVNQSILFPTALTDSECIELTTI